ncbi:MAG TPA: hypothetical protein VHB77_11985 [Planctomycetaceae bacterium]|nr:hypothetical protein [Planctomycetaceae bacterium]
MLQKLFELALVLAFFVFCLWYAARPVFAVLEILGTDAARAERRRREALQTEDPPDDSGDSARE